MAEEERDKMEAAAMSALIGKLTVVSTNCRLGTWGATIGEGEVAEAISDLIDVKIAIAIELLADRVESQLGMRP